MHDFILDFLFVVDLKYSDEKKNLDDCSSHAKEICIDRLRTGYGASRGSEMK